MVFVTDIGNTNIVCGVYNQNDLIWSCRLSTEKCRTSDEYFSLLISLQADKWNTGDIVKIGIASVVPELTRIWRHLFLKYFAAEIRIVDGYSEIGLSYLVEDPGFIGADLIVNALGAWKKYGGNNIIVDLGTATTIQVVSSAGRFLGAIIAPGIRTGAQNLFENTAQLSEIQLSSSDVLLGTNTRDALLSGIIRGHAYMVEGFINAIKKDFSYIGTLSVIATGGIIDLLSEHIPSIDTVDKTLTLDGLNLAIKSQTKDI